MNDRDLRSDLATTPSGNVEILVQRIRNLQKEKDAVVRGKDNLSLILRNIERKLRSFLKELDIDETLFFAAESEDIDGLIGALFVVVKMLYHETECRGRDQRRLYGMIDDFRKKVRELEKDNKALEMSNIGLEMKVGALEGEVRRVKRRNNRKTE